MRAGACEMHSISALVGGLAAQEIIKIVTQQYVPVDNCLVFDGVSASIHVFHA